MDADRAGLPGLASPWLGPVAVLIPVKAFANAKLRLAPALAAAERASLARSMAEMVMAAAGPLPVSVVCDDPVVADWARQRGALVVWEPGRGLNGAVQAGVDRLRKAGADRVIVAHSDLPLAGEGLRALADPTDGNVVILVPDRSDNGTNVVSVPSRAGFRFFYGPGSFERHCAEVRRLSLRLRVVRDPRLTFDVDVPDDLATLNVRVRTSG